MKNIKDYDLLKYCVMKAIRHLRQFYSSVAILNWNTGGGGIIFSQMNSRKCISKDW